MIFLIKRAQICSAYICKKVKCAYEMSEKTRFSANKVLANSQSAP